MARAGNEATRGGVKRRLRRQRLCGFTGVNSMTLPVNYHGNGNPPFSNGEILQNPTIQNLEL